MDKLDNQLQSTSFTGVMPNRYVNYVENYIVIAFTSTFLVRF